MTTEKSLFHTEVVNENGVEGEAYVKNGGLKVTVSSPMDDDQEGTNPEELIGLAFSTCLNATIQSLLKSRGLNNKSRVNVQVDLFREKSGIGFYFEVLALGSIEGMTVEQATPIIESAEKRCPVSKLMMGSETVTVRTQEYQAQA